MRSGQPLIFKRAQLWQKSVNRASAFSKQNAGFLVFLPLMKGGIKDVIKVATIETVVVVAKFTLNGNLSLLFD